MALDPNIALQYKAPVFDNPLAQFAQVSQIKAAQQQNRLAELAFGEKEREIGESRALNDAYKSALAPDGTIDRNKLYTGAASAGLGSKLPAIQKGFADQDKAAADALKSKLENGIKEIEFGAQVFSGVRDQASYDQARQHVAQVLGPERAAQMPAVYDPATIEANRLKALTVKDQLAQKWKELEFGELKRHNVATEGNQAGTLAVAQGNLGVNQAREAREANAPKGQFDTERGLLIDPRTGVARPVMDAEGKPLAAKEKPLTEVQSKAAGFAARAQEADKIIEGLGGKFSSAAINSKSTVESTPLLGGILGASVNKFGMSSNDRQAEQAQRDFINAVLRQESGAAIGAEEFTNARKQYFVQPGEEKDAALVEQKARNRRLAIEALKSSAGPGAANIGGMVGRSKIDLTKVKPGTPEYEAVMADASRIGALRNQPQPKIVDFGSLK